MDPATGKGTDSAKFSRAEGGGSTNDEAVEGVVTATAEGNGATGMVEEPLISFSLDSSPCSVLANDGEPGEEEEEEDGGGGGGICERGPT